VAVAGWGGVGRVSAVFHTLQQIRRPRSAGASQGVSSVPFLLPWALAVGGPHLVLAEVRHRWLTAVRTLGAGTHDRATDASSARGAGAPEPAAALADHLVASSELVRITHGVAPPEHADAVADDRAALGTMRRFTIPLLEQLDLWGPPASTGSCAGSGRHAPRGRASAGRAGSSALRRSPRPPLRRSVGHAPAAVEPRPRPPNRDLGPAPQDPTPPREGGPVRS
jgi:hypothetical protein